ncbi:hypothetical protein ACFX13_025102 [Malus domestica]
MVRLGFGDVQLRETLKDADFARERRRIGVARVRVCGLFCLRKREWQCGQIWKRENNLVRRRAAVVTGKW